MSEFNHLDDLRDGHAPERLQAEISGDREKGLVTARLKGRLDIFTYRDLARQLEAATDQIPDVRLVVDFAGVTFVASSGWSVFVAMRSKLQRQGGKMAFSGMAEDLARVYGAMRMPELVPLYDNAETAQMRLSHGS